MQQCYNAGVSQYFVVNSVSVVKYWPWRCQADIGADFFKIDMQDL